MVYQVKLTTEQREVLDMLLREKMEAISGAFDLGEEVLDILLQSLQNTIISESVSCEYCKDDYYKNP
jgi:hypothetical protein